MDCTSFLRKAADGCFNRSEVAAPDAAKFRSGPAWTGCGDAAKFRSRQAWTGCAEREKERDSRFNFDLNTDQRRHNLTFNSQRLPFEELSVHLEL
ncbi:hypothetical protein SLA2020_140620 [Shorea laevis]